MLTSAGIPGKGKVSVTFRPHPQKCLGNSALMENTSKYLFWKISFSLTVSLLPPIALYKQPESISIVQWKRHQGRNTLHALLAYSFIHSKNI